MSSSENVELPVLKTVGSSRMRLLFAGLVVLLFLALLVRLARVASQMEIGWESVARQWRAASVGPFGGNHQPLSSLEPADQAAFWLRETQQVIAEEPNNADLAMGAALLLDSPGNGFMNRYMTVSEPLSKVGVTVPQADHKAASLAVNNFEEKCRAQCLAMAAKATELQPKETRWWRLRANLLFNGELFGDGQGATRDPDWLHILQQCRDHDPENALYDYLAAWKYWREGLDTDSLEMPVVDQTKFNLGTECFLRGQRKRFCDIGGGEGPLAVGLLRRTTVPHMEYENIVAGRSMLYRVSLMMRALERIQATQAQRLEKKGDLTGTLALYRQSLHMLDQFAQPAGEIAFEAMPFFLRCGVLTSMQTLVEKHPGLVTPDAAARIKNDARAAERDEKRYSEASKRMAAERNLPASPLFFTIATLANVAVLTVPLLFLTGAITYVLARCLCKPGESDAARLGVIRHFAAWLAAYGLTFAVFGMGAAGILSSTVQGWFPHGSSQAAGGLDARLFQQTVIAKYGQWNWAIYQWMLYAGPYISVGVALAIVGIWHQNRLRRSCSTASIPPRYRRADQFACLGRSMLTAAALWMLAYLWLMPTVLQFGENVYQAKMAYLRNPRSYMDAMTKAMADVPAEQERPAR